MVSVSVVLGLAASVKTLMPAEKALDAYVGVWCVVGTLLSIFAPEILKRVALWLVRITPLPIRLFLMGMAAYALAAVPAAALHDEERPSDEQERTASTQVPENVVDEDEHPRVLTAETRLESVADRRPKSVTGELSSSVDRCVADRRISLIPAAIRPGETRAARVVHTRSGKRGRWSTSKASPHIRYEVVIEGDTKGAGSDQRVRCTAVPRAVTLLAASGSAPVDPGEVAVGTQIPDETTDLPDVVPPQPTPAPPPDDGSADNDSSGGWGDPDYTKPTN
ncbi:MAG: hypothetical protein M3285_13685 [Actinomycetota bacterium]|nr:hypothetical protein [Actinomycetota bacterium]